MSRNIPPVRTWRVRCWGADGTLLANVTIDTINKRFARWLARARACKPFYGTNVSRFHWYATNKGETGATGLTPLSP